MPAREASSAVAATVVPPVAPCAIATGRSRALSFSAPSVATSRSSSSALEADVGDSVEHRDRRGHRAAVGDRPLELERGLEVLGARQAVRDDRRFERDDRVAVAERAGDLLGDNDCSRCGPHRRTLPNVPASEPERYGADTLAPLVCSTRSSRRRRSITRAIPATQSTIVIQAAAISHPATTSVVQ